MFLQKINLKSLIRAKKHAVKWDFYAIQELHMNSQ